LRNALRSFAVTLPFRMLLVVTLFLEAVMAMAVEPPAMATIRARVATTLA